MEEIFITKEVPTYYAEICVGLREQYTDKIHDLDELIEEVTDWLKENRDGFTVTPTTFYYVGGWEPGALIRTINYPRLPREKEKIFENAKSLALRLKKKFGQIRMSIIMPDRTVMFSNDPEDEKK